MDIQHEALESGRGLWFKQLSPPGYYRAPIPPLGSALSFLTLRERAARQKV
jgi:hypothetical protein